MTGSADYGDRDRRNRFRRLSRYDLVLAVIPLAFVVGLFAATVLSVSVEGGIAIGSTVGTVAVTDALFLNPPARGRRRTG